MAVAVRHMTRARALAHVARAVEFHRAWAESYSLKGDHSGAACARGSMATAQRDLIYLRRGGNWRLIETTYPYTSYRQY